MTVIPTVVVDRNLPGCFASARAARASARPSFAHCCSRLLRADSSAVSASTKTPLARMRSKSSRNASMWIGRISGLGCTSIVDRTSSATLARPHLQEDFEFVARTDLVIRHGLQKIGQLL